MKLNLHRGCLCIQASVQVHKGSGYFHLELSQGKTAVVKYDAKAKSVQVGIKPIMFMKRGDHFRLPKKLPTKLSVLG